MHNHLSDSLQTGIGLFYFLVMLMNVGFALYQHYERKDQLQTIIWGVVAGVFGVHALAYLLHFGWSIFPWHLAIDHWFSQFPRQVVVQES